MASEVLEEAQRRGAQLLQAADDCNDALLSNIDLNLNDLSPRADELLTRMAEYKNMTNIRILNPMYIHCWYSELEMEKMEYKQLILELEQGIKSIETKNSRDRDDLELFREDLKIAKERIERQNAAEEFSKNKCVLESKMSRYEKQLNECAGKLSQCNIPIEILPANIKCLESEINSVKAERDQLQTIVDNINIAKSAKKDLINLRQKYVQTPSK